MWNNCMSMSFHKWQEQWGSHKERQSLAELRMTCWFVGRWCEADLPVCWSHPDSSGPVTKGRNSCIKVGDHVSSKSRTSIFRNFETVIVLLLIKKLASCRFRACSDREVPLTGSIPLGLQCTGNLWQLQCQLDVFRRGYQLVLCYRRLSERQQQMSLQYTELFMTAVCYNNHTNFGIIFLQGNFH